MNPADIAIGVIVAISVVVGLVRGLVVEVLSLVVWIAAVALAMTFGPSVAEAFGGSIELPSARVALGYAIVFVSVLLVGALVVFLMRKLVQGTGLSGTDRVLGMVFGLARGAIVVVVLVLVLGFTPLPRDPWWRESRALPLFEGLAQAMAQWLPAPVARYIEYGLAAGAAGAAPDDPAAGSPKETEPGAPKDLQ